MLRQKSDHSRETGPWKWGEPETGGTRYNNRAVSETPPTKDYMWRSDTSVNFCTKGYDCFWLAWEETGDPRMLEAFRAQVIDASTEHFIFEITGKLTKIEQFVALMQPLGLVEVSRTGLAAISRGAERM